ncbi:hypothetical protein ACJMK2_006705 [Sinanodonta woodiana]|uniref:Adenosine deaminase n=1 Tax=Sinanodonta woodiana TaxID=1069815 RepID=A0ABD3VX65_SINWO
MTTMAGLRDLNSRFPYKVELHVHLDGAARLTTILETARRRKLLLPADNLEDLKKSICVYHAKSLYKVLEAFTLFMPVIAGDRDCISRIAYEFCEDCANNGIRYVEARYSPHLLSNNEEKPEYALEHGDLTPREVVQIVNDAFARGSIDYGIIVKSILCCMRHRPDWSNEVVALANDFRSAGVVAIDIAGGFTLENIEGIPEGHKEAFKKAKDLGIRITVHAGEDGPAASVKEALDDLYAERIGHGYHCLDDPDIYSEVKEKQIHLENCPVSSIRTGAVIDDIKQHPLLTFAADGVNFSINSDDPLVFDSTLVDDYSLALEAGLTDKQIISGIFNAARSSFANEAEKQKVLKDLEEVYGAGF